SGSESDGQSAQHKVDTEEAREQAKGARRGPSNASMQHFHEPVAVMDKKKGARWEFKCRYCECVRSVERTVKGPKVSFDDEGKLPKLNNLATHSNECRGKSKPQERSDEGNGTEQSTAEGLNLKRSADLMRNYLKDGELNPEALTTERGFLRLFAAWILDEDLPWTTGEAPSLRLLFKYLKVRYMLPSDTTVRNQLAKIFAELNAKVVKSFTAIDTWTFETEEMRPLLIDKKEWKLLEDLADILEPFTHVTLIMSRTSQPTIPFVLPAYHQLDTHLEAKSTETSLPKILTNAASVGLEKLRKYKRLADGNRFYVLGTGAFPIPFF
ncbi:hypothetical protein F5877DRAFT_49611, partial [Lentinula edodes]